MGTFSKGLKTNTTFLNLSLSEYSEIPLRETHFSTNFYNQRYKPLNIKSNLRLFLYRVNSVGNFYNSLQVFLSNFLLTKLQGIVSSTKNNLHVISTDHSMALGVLLSLPCWRGADAVFVMITTASVEKALSYNLLRFCLTGLSVQENGHSYI